MVPYTIKTLLSLKDILKALLSRGIKNYITILKNSVLEKEK